MRNLKNIPFGIFFLLTVVAQESHSAQAVIKTAQISAEKVDKEMSLLDQIIEQANRVVDGADQRIRNQAKKELISLMKRKDLDAKIKDAISDDIEIIKKSKAKGELHAARIRLLNTYTKINSQANVVETIAEATAMVKNASPENLEETIAQAKEKIEKAEEEQQSTMGRWYAKAKRMVTAPVDYVFGEESSYAKTAFYGTVGLAFLAAGAYGVYQYGSGNEEQRALAAKAKAAEEAQLDVLMAQQRELEAKDDSEVADLIKRLSSTLYDNMKVLLAQEARIKDLEDKTYRTQKENELLDDLRSKKIEKQAQVEHLEKDVLKVGLLGLNSVDAIKENARENYPQEFQKIEDYRSRLYSYWKQEKEHADVMERRERKEFLLGDKDFLKEWRKNSRVHLKEERALDTLRSGLSWYLMSDSELNDIERDVIDKIYGIPFTKNDLYEAKYDFFAKQKTVDDLEKKKDKTPEDLAILEDLSTDLSTITIIIKEMTKKLLDAYLLQPGESLNMDLQIEHKYGLKNKNK